MREKVIGLVIGGGAVSAFTVLLGRMWTSSYYDYFGLPIADLTLEVQDYAFRTKEILLMLVIAGGLVAGIGWGPEALKIPKIQVGHENSTWARWGSLFPTFWSWVFICVVGVLVTFVALALAQPRYLENYWRWYTILVGATIGVGAGLIVAFVRANQAERAVWVTAAALLAIFVVLVPFTMVHLARASAAHDVRTQNLPHVVLQFENTAPAPIRRADDPTRSTRVYLVLSTPERLAVAFPYPCTQVGTAGGGTTRDVDLCDILTFDRDVVTTIEIVGKGGRPSNDEPGKSESVALAVGALEEDDLAPRVVYEQAYDFSNAMRNRLECRVPGSPASDLRLHGVWFRLEARQAGRVEPVTEEVRSPTEDQDLTYVLADTEDERACREIPDTGRIRVDANSVVRLFVGMKDVNHDRTRRIVRLRFSPLDALASDCTIVRAPEGAPTADCPEETDGGMGMRVHVPAGTELTAAVEVEGGAFVPTSDNQCPNGARLPRAFASGVPLGVTGCQLSPLGEGRLAVVFGVFIQRGTDGPVDLVACPNTDAEDRIIGVHGLLSRSAAPAEPTRPTGPENPAESGGQAPPVGPVPSDTAPVVTAC